MFRPSIRKVLEAGRSGMLTTYGLVGLLGLALTARLADSALMLLHG